MRNQFEQRPPVSSASHESVPSTILYQTRQTVFYHISRHPDESLNYDAQGSIFDEQQQEPELSWEFCSIFIPVACFEADL